MKNGQIDPGRISEMSNVQKQMEQARTVLKALQDQRKGGLKALEAKANSLLNSIGDFNKTALESEDQGKILTSALRDLTQAVNSTQLVLESHDKLIDMVIGDLGGIVDKTNSAIQGVMQTSAMLEACLRVLLDKGVLTQEEVKEEFNSLVSETQNAAQKIRQEENQETDVLKV